MRKHITCSTSHVEPRSHDFLRTRQEVRMQHSALHGRPAIGSSVMHHPAQPPLARLGLQLRPWRLG